MIGVEAYDILLLRIVVFDMGEEQSYAAIHIRKPRAELCLVDLEIGQAHARSGLFPRKEPMSERQTRLDLGGKAKSHCVPRMHIGEMEECEEISLSERIDQVDHAVCTNACRLIPGCRDQAVIAAHRTVVDAVRRQDGCDRVVAEVLHTFRECLHSGGEFVARSRMKELCVMWIAPRLDGGQRRVGVFRCGEMCVEDRPACKETRYIWHPFRKVVAYDIPRERVDEEVQYELFARGAVPQENGRAYGERRIVLTGQSGWSREPHIAVRPFA